MATERRKMKKKSVLKDELEKPTKEEYSVARCLRFQGPSKEGKFNGNFCPYFVGSKVVDFLLSESQWGTKCANKTNQLYASRSSCVTYCARLLEKGFFHRVEKIDRRERLMATAATSSTQSSKKSSAGDKLQSKDGTPGLTKRNKGKKDRDTTEQQPQLPDEQTEKKNDDDVTKAAAAAAAAGKTAASDATTATSTAAKEDGVNEEKKKRRKPAKLRMHDNQTFIDSPDALYVWIYDPVPLKTYVIGALLVIGSIVVCLFPLWPPELKSGIYYLSLLALGFIGIILALYVLRLIVFIVVSIFSRFKVSLWILPNLTEDVGFFDSFRPLYTVEYKKKAVEGSSSSAGEKDKTETREDADNDDDFGERERGKSSKRRNKRKKKSYDNDVEDVGGHCDNGDDDFRGKGRYDNDRAVADDDNDPERFADVDDDDDDDDNNNNNDDDDDDGDNNNNDDGDDDNNNNDDDDGDNDEDDDEQEEEEEDDDGDGGGDADNGSYEMVEAENDDGGDDVINEPKKHK